MPTVPDLPTLLAAAGFPGLSGTLLDELAQLRECAHEQALTLRQWRALHETALAAVGATPDPGRLGELREMVLAAALEVDDRTWELRHGLTTRDRHPDDGPTHALATALTTAGEARLVGERLWSLHQQLVVLEGPPTDSAVTTVLPQSDRDREDTLVNHDPRLRPALAARFSRERQLHEAWFAEVTRRTPPGWSTTRRAGSRRRTSPRRPDPARTGPPG